MINRIIKTSLATITTLFLLLQNSNSFEIVEAGERQCSSRMSSAFLSANGNWKRFNERALFERGMQIEKRIKRNSKNPHVVLVQSKGNSSKVVLNRSRYVEECRTLLQILRFRIRNRKEVKNQIVSKQNYYNFYKNRSLSNKDGALLRKFNFNFRDSKNRCVNTAKFIERHSFSEREQRLAKGFIERAKGQSSAVASPLSKENYASALIPSSTNDRRGLCAFVRLRSTKIGKEYVKISIRELTEN